MGCAQYAEQLSLGQGVPLDAKRAAVLLESACGVDEGDACQALARLYHVGSGVAKDETRASELMGRACGLGITQACGYPGSGTNRR